MQGFAGLGILSNVVEIGGASVSAFGTLETAELTPAIQLDFVYGINTQTGASASSGSGATVDTSSARLRLQCGTASNGSAQFNSRRAIRYRAGQGTTARFTAAFAAGTLNNTQIVGVGTATNGYFFGYDPATGAFGILHRNAGSDNWIAQTAWNGDKLDGTGPSAVTLAPGNGNVYQIKYPFLGYGTIKFYVESPMGSWILVHTIAYPNTTASLQLSNPALFFYAQTVNTGNTSNLTTYVGSVGIFVSGPRSFIGTPKWAYDNGKSGVTAETNIFSLKAATTYNGVTNRGIMRLTSISAVLYAASGNSWGTLRLRIGASLGGSPSWATINGTSADSGVTITAGNSMVSADVAGTTASGGTLLWNMALGQGMIEVDLTPYELFLAPTEILTVGGFASASSTIAAALNWNENI